VTREIKRPAAVAVMLISIFAGLVAALLWLMPKPFTRFEYLIAGTAATVFTLLALFLVLTPGASATFRRILRRDGTGADIASTGPAASPRTVRRSGQSS
jgi:uncharacterized membrane protein YozB (DUF420 family)